MHQIYRFTLIIYFPISLSIYGDSPIVFKREVVIQNAHVYKVFFSVFRRGASSGNILIVNYPAKEKLKPVIHFRPNLILKDMVKNIYHIFQESLN